jgi:glycosyltransferase involved in cell wall biosynthesis
VSGRGRLLARLAINGWRLHGSHTGVGRYLANILKHWSAEAIEGRFESVVLYTPAPLDRGALGLPNVVRDRILGPHWRLLVWENLTLGPSIHDDLLFCPSYSRPLGTRARCVVTCFEATQKLFPSYYPLKVRLVNTPLYGWSARHAELVITSSEAARSDIASAYGVDPAQIRVVHLAASESFRLVRDPELLAKARADYLGSQDPFFLYVGKLTARRNIPKLMEAFAEFRRRTALPHRLLVVGLNTTRLRLDELAETLGIAEPFRHYEYVDDENLNLLYNAAESFVLPYTYEAGFSLTALEAQVAGTPVVTVDAPGLRESTGSAALFVPAAEVGKIAEAMCRVALEAALREELSIKGLANARLYSWERASLETLELLAEVARRGTRTA